MPVERVERFAARNGAELDLLHSDHGLNDQLTILSNLLERLLDQVLADSAGT